MSQELQKLSDRQLLATATATPATVRSVEVHVPWHVLMVVHLVSERHYAVGTTSDGTSPSEIINLIEVISLPLWGKRFQYFIE